MFLRKKWKIKEKYGSFVIKEFFKKEGILKTGEFCQNYSFFKNFLGVKTQL